jgi:hypothetical protein
MALLQPQASLFISRTLPLIGLLSHNPIDPNQWVIKQQSQSRYQAISEIRKADLLHTNQPIDLLAVEEELQVLL